MAAGKIDDVLMTEDILIESVKMGRDDPSFKKTLYGVLLSLFVPMKVEMKGYFNYGRYRKIFANIGIADTNFTKTAFAAVDSNHDKYVSVAEYLVDANDYVCSDDENSTAMFGLLF